MAFDANVIGVGGPIVGEKVRCREVRSVLTVTAEWDLEWDTTERQDELLNAVTPRSTPRVQREDDHVSLPMRPRVTRTDINPCPEGLEEPWANPDDPFALRVGRMQSSRARGSLP